MSNPNMESKIKELMELKRMKEEIERNVSHKISVQVKLITGKSPVLSPFIV